jgi:hydrogenase/urease accessory protein HupE
MMRAGHPLALLLLWVVALTPDLAAGHAFKPGLLALEEIDVGRFDARWRPPTHRGRAAAGLRPTFPPHCSVTQGEAGPRSVDCGAAGLLGTVEVHGLRSTSAGILLRVGWRNGEVRTEILAADRPAARIEGQARQEPASAARSFALFWTGVGAQHIWLGPDHLLFVLGLLLLVAGFRELLWTVTAFTLAHSLTLAASALGKASLPGPPVEAAIALSIVLLAVELSRTSDGLTRRWPWLAALGFGLLHGFGFAGALMDFGLPESRRVAALFLFNLGVELGQVLFVCLMFFPVVWLRSRPRAVRVLPVYAMGAVAMFWTLQRVAGFWP